MYEPAALWLPGFEPGSVLPPAMLPATQGTLPKAVLQALSAVPSLWPDMPDALWERKFSPAARYEMNVKALKVAAGLAPGAKPSQSDAEALNLFTGWGALPDHLGSSYTSLPNIKAQREDALKTLGKTGFESASKALLSSFFTPPALARAVWKGIEALGFAGGRILEPSAGAGMFLAQMPKSIADRSQITAIELDESTATVLRSLYAPYGVQVTQGAFEATVLPPGYFDLVVTNVPFGAFGVAERRAVPYKEFLIHDYFIARALELVRDGGLVAVLVSSGTMEKYRDDARCYFASKAKLIEAVRLPNSAFKVFAGTEPTVDLLVFQRLRKSEAANGDAWRECTSVTSSLPGVDLNTRLNAWFQQHRDRLLGAWTKIRQQYGEAREACLPDGSDYLARLDAIMASLPRVYEAAAAAPNAPVQITGFDPTLLPGSFVLDGDNVHVVSTSGLAVPCDAKMTSADRERIVGMVAVRDAATALVRADAAEGTEHVALRATLNQAYDAFRQKFGPLTRAVNLRAFHGDPAVPVLRALEKLDDKGNAVKAEVFERRTVNAATLVAQCDSPQAAIPVSLAHHGRLVPELIGSLCKMEPLAAMAQLLAVGAAFHDPVTQQWETATAYLSGDVKTKLEQAKAAGTDYAPNVEALEAVQPVPLTEKQIGARIGATWIPVDVYAAFMESEILSVGTKASVSVNSLTGTWDVSPGRGYAATVAARNKYGTGDADVIQLFKMALNQRLPLINKPDPADHTKRVKDDTATLEAREKQQALKDRFAQWLWENTDRAAKLVECYNATFNRHVARKYDGSHLTLPGFSNLYTLRPNQKDGVWRIVSSDTNTLLGHKVGAGKTLTMICAGMELKRLGMASKPCFVVPNNALDDFSTEFIKAYPAANVLIATEKDFNGDARGHFLARVAMANWDGIVMTHSSFERIRAGDDIVNEFIQERLNELQMASGVAKDNRTAKAIERRKAMWEAKLAKLVNAKGSKDDALSFAQLGIDWLFVDEAHYFKNLVRVSNMDRIAGLPDSDSQRAFDMLLKVRYIQSVQRGRGVCFATGTPIANSMAEMHTMQTFLQPQRLADAGVASFDAWAANFGEVVTSVEVAPDGSGYRMNSRFARFINLPDLLGMFHDVADIRTAEMLDLGEPDYDKDTIAVPASQELKDVVAAIVDRAELVHKRQVKPDVDNMLKITTDGRMAALDLRLVGVTQPAGGKVDKLVENVARIHRETTSIRGAQVVFCDLGTPGGKTFCVYDAVRQGLILAGVPEAEIAYIHEATTHASRKAMTQSVSAGKVRVIIGSTQRLGVAANLQHRLVALHHLDAPWRPADVEQREGRILRQGNSNARVRIFRYATEGSFDAYIWQTLETKARFIAQVMVGENISRTAEDVELAALTYAEVKAIASCNPAVLEKVAVDAKVAKLSILRSAHIANAAMMRKAAQSLPERIERLKKLIVATKEDAAACGSMSGLALETPAGSVTDKVVIGKVIAKIAAGLMYSGGKPVAVGRIGPFKLSVLKRTFSGTFQVCLEGAAKHEAEFSGGAVSAVNALDHLLTKMRQGSGEDTAYLATLERELEQVKGEVGKPFEHEDSYRKAVSRQQEINASLGLAKAA